MGELIPIYVKDTLPGDVFRINTEALIQFLPLVTPVMHEVEAEVLFFFGEDRNEWPEFEKFISGRESVVRPTIESNGLSEGSLATYMFLPPNMTDTTQDVYAVPFNLALRIWDFWFRNKEVQDPIAIDLVAGDNADLRTIVQGDPLHSNWAKDQWTSCLPEPALGGDVLLPILQDNASVHVTLDTSQAGVKNQLIKQASDYSTLLSGAVGGESPSGIFQLTSGTDAVLDLNESHHITAAEMNAASALMRDVRKAEAYMKWSEKGIRGGSDTHKDYLWTYHRVRSRDLRLDQPHLIGSTKIPVKFSQIRSTSETIDSGDNIDSPIGVLAGHGQAMGGSNKTLTYRCPDHGWIIGYLRVRPKTSYSQGIPRMYQRSSRYDYYFDDLARIGEVAVKNKEIYGLGNSTTNEATFGYMPMYFDYLYCADRITGQVDGLLLNQWTLSRKFGASPNLNDAFLKCTPTKDIFADTTSSNDSLVIWVVNHVHAARQIHALATPSI